MGSSHRDTLSVKLSCSKSLGNIVKYPKISLQKVVVVGDQRKVKYGVRGTEVRGLNGGGRMLLSTKTCSIDRS